MLFRIDQSREKPASIATSREEKIPVLFTNYNREWQVNGDERKLLNIVLVSDGILMERREQSVPNREV
jgi:hypothetical protein